MQIDRLLEMVLLLLERKNVTAAELAERFEVSVRTVYRDIETLSAAGVPVYATRGKGGGISVLERYTLGKGLVSAEEQRQILAALQSVRATGAQEVDDLCQKLGGLFQQSGTDWLEVDFTGWGGEHEKRMFALLRDAVLEKRVVELWYSGGNGAETHRVVEPLRLVFRKHSWYLYAWCRLRDGERFFKLTRVREAHVLRESVSHKAPTGTTLVDFTGKTVDLVLRLDRALAFRVYDEFTGYERLEDGGFVVAQRVPEGDWLFGWLLSFGAGCEVLSPPEVRAEVRQQLRNALRHYEQEE